jgi:DnaJ-class molecular chaperone with C-terminal Zn finger domain
MDPHHVLGVSPGASEAEIKAAYRRAGLRGHPDRNAARDAAASRDRGDAV